MQLFSHVQGCRKETSQTLEANISITTGPIELKFYVLLALSLAYLHIKFQLNWPSGYGDISFQRHLPKRVSRAMEKENHDTALV